MTRGLTFAAALALCLLAARPLVAQGVRADTGGVAIGRDLINSTVNIGIPPEQLAMLVRQSTDLSEAQKKLIAKLEGELDLNRRQIRAALDVLGEANVEPENLSAKLVEVAERFKALRATAVAKPGDDPKIAALKAEAQQAIEAGDLTKADALLSDVRTEQRRARAEHQRALAEEQRALDLLDVDEAENLARRGDLAMTRLRYRDAAKHFADAAALLAPGGSHEDKRIDYLEEEATALVRQGTDFGDGDAMRSAAARCRVLVDLKPRDRVPLKWAWAQNRLGFVLSNIGERESGTARFEAALAAYAEAHKELTRASRPADWAIVETNRGIALERIGLRERRTAQLDESVAAYREAVKIFQDKRMPLRWAWAQHNLALALSRRGESDRGTAHLEQAIDAYRRALEVYTREQSPHQWALMQNELGNALRDLGMRERGTARLEEAVAVQREALTELKRERAPLPWSKAQHDLATTLVDLAQHERGTARLEEAIATYDEALKERPRDRNPGLWAGSTGRQGVALMMLARRTENADMAERAAAQIEAALDLMRSKGDLIRADYFGARLQRARALVQRLRQP